MLHEHPLDGPKRQAVAQVRAREENDMTTSVVRNRLAVIAAVIAVALAAFDATLANGQIVSLAEIYLP